MTRFIALFALWLLISATLSPPEKWKQVRVYVALCDNESQGIVPVPAKIGNGNDPDQNLYWGCGYGFRTFFKKSAEWILVKTEKNPEGDVMEKLFFKHKTKKIILIAEAWRGKEIQKCISTFLKCAAGNLKSSESITLPEETVLTDASKPDLVSFIGHNGLMDFSVPMEKTNKTTKDSIPVLIYCCAAKNYFAEHLKSAGAYPLIWTTGLMCPEAYSLKASLDGWVQGETGQSVRIRTATAYDQYQKCGMKGALGLFRTGW